MHLAIKRRRRKVYIVYITWTEHMLVWEILALVIPFSLLGNIRSSSGISPRTTRPSTHLDMKKERTPCQPLSWNSHLVFGPELCEKSTHPPKHTFMPTQQPSGEATHHLWLLKENTWILWRLFIAMSQLQPKKSKVLLLHINEAEL